MTTSVPVQRRVHDRGRRGGITTINTVRLALRELRSGLSGFYIFIACVALGVMVIAASGTLSAALKSGFQREGAAIIGGDMSFARMHVRASDSERAWLEARGGVSETASLRAIAQRLDGEEQALVELKGVDGAYPMTGGVRLDPDSALSDVLKAGTFAAADPVLMQQLGVKAGDRIRIGEAEVEIRAAVLAEPDAIADRLTYGPRVFISLDTLKATGLIKPGTLVRWRYALKLPGEAGRSETSLTSLRADAKTQMPNAGFTITDRRDPSPQVSKTLERLRQFLTMLGLTALLTGGVGVANAVAGYVDKRRKDIATLRSLGASGRLVFTLLLVQIMAMATIGVAIGLALGVAIPSALTQFYGDALPIKAELAVSWSSLATAAGYGFLVALLFALWPLGRAEHVSASVLFRDGSSDVLPWPRTSIIATSGLAGLALAATAILSADSHLIAFYFCAGIVLMFALFASLGHGVTWFARSVKRPRRPEFALAIGNLGAPDGQTRLVVLSLGTGLSMLAAVAVANASLVEELSSRMPANSPSYFVLDIPKSDIDAVERLVLKEAPGAHIVKAPMLRGRLVKLGDRSVEQIKAPPEAQWVLNGDRGLTYADVVPEGSKIVQGSWWPPGYAGEPLVSFESELASKLGVSIGDQVTVNVLGRDVSARISNLREVKWESLALNFVMVFSPNVLSSAPHNILASITLPKTVTIAEEVRLARVLGKAYPAITTIRVKDAIAAFNKVFSKVMVAVQTAGGVTLLAGALVLAGALATARRRRIMEAVILKALGATRRRIMGAHFAEYVMLAGITALFAVGAGALAAWVAVAGVMELTFSFSWGAVAALLALALGLVAAFGAAGTFMVLRARPVPYLRAD